jgi:hypothetical protein
MTLNQIRPLRSLVQGFVSGLLFSAIVVFWVLA